MYAEVRAEVLSKAEHFVGQLLQGMWEGTVDDGLKLAMTALRHMAEDDGYKEPGEDLYRELPNDGMG